MRSLIVIALLLILTAAPRLARAYGSSERDEMKADIREAINRARDFSRQKVEEATEDLERQKGAKEVKEKRAKFEAEQEAEREEFVRERNERPSDFLTQARLERAFDEEKVLEDREMERSRKQYSKDHKKVERIIEKKAYINENEEYGL